jgi:hypothetical protein
VSDELSLDIHLCVCFFQGRTQTILLQLQELKPQYGKFLYDPHTTAATIPSLSSLGAVSDDAVQCKTSFINLASLQQVIITNEACGVTIICLNEMLLSILDAAFRIKKH